MAPASVWVNPNGDQVRCQLTALSIRLATFCSTSGVQSTMAYVTGHIGPSSRLSESLNPRVA